MESVASKRAVSTEYVDDIGRCQSLLPRESDFIGRKGYSRHCKEDGSYTWRYRFEQNERGKRTKAGHEVLERMTPFMRADTARHAAVEAKRPRVALRDGAGAVRLVDPALADTSARANGWSHVASVSGNRVEGGIDGMLFKQVGRVWHATGRWCMSEPWTQSSRPAFGRRDGSIRPRGVYHDPDGHPWRWIAGSWRRTD